MYYIQLLAGPYKTTQYTIPTLSDLAIYHNSIHYNYTHTFHDICLEGRLAYNYKRLQGIILPVQSL